MEITKIKSVQYKHVGLLFPQRDLFIIMLKLPILLVAELQSRTAESSCKLFLEELDCWSSTWPTPIQFISLKIFCKWYVNESNSIVYSLYRVVLSDHCSPLSSMSVFFLVHLSVRYYPSEWTNNYLSYYHIMADESSGETHQWHRDRFRRTGK